MKYIKYGRFTKVLNVKTPTQATEKWFGMKPEIFKQKPVELKNKILALKNSTKSGFHKQSCEP
ncbi:MAG: hypothetical protein R6U11_07080 [Bacteroidales bacterium]